MGQNLTTLNLHIYFEKLVRSGFLKIWYDINEIYLHKAKYHRHCIHLQNSGVVCMGIPHIFLLFTYFKEVKL